MPERYKGYMIYSVREDQRHTDGWYFFNPVLVGGKPTGPFGSMAQAMNRIDLTEREGEKPCVSE